MLRVYREPVDEFALLQNNCSDLSDLSVQLYTQTSAEGEQPVFSLRGVQSSDVNLTQGGWVEFLNLTSMYKSLIETVLEELEDGALATAVLNTRLTVSSPSCANLTPSSLGFISVAEYRAQLVGFEENLINNDRSFSDMMSSIARSRRSAERPALATEAPSSGTNSENPTLSSASEPLSNPGDYEQRRCTLYRHHVSLTIPSSV